ncbi:unnamed protein product [Dibothriocephalus latus]|uniref:Uncharacterized protein n=1 Tax=Dibothriocephalus latus TaxID=60516 RepID=A0A3P7P636_DIBLA|nr:unnamed protein product [Dibothriocephalus latus]
MVDSLYSDNHTDGTNKLVCYCVRKPDKLDNIAKYLHKRLSYDLNHLNYENVNITVEAMSALVNACYAVKLNLFDSSFLKMVQLLLESKLPELQLLGTKSIEEDAPNYHREYDELIDQFCRMSYSNLPDIEERKKVRVAGIQGLQGVVRKTARDQLRMNVLQSASMDQIIPALLFNIREGSPTGEEPDESELEPSRQAVFVFKDVVCRASYTNIVPVVKAILSYLDGQRIWVPSDFALLIFGYLLDSIKVSYYYVFAYCLTCFKPEKKMIISREHSFQGIPEYLPSLTDTFRVKMYYKHEIAQRIIKEYSLIGL